MPKIYLINSSYYLPKQNKIMNNFLSSYFCCFRVLWLRRKRKKWSYKISHFSNLKKEKEKRLVKQMISLYLIILWNSIYRWIGRDKTMEVYKNSWPLFYFEYLMRHGNSWIPHQTISPSSPTNSFFFLFSFIKKKNVKENLRFMLHTIWQTSNYVIWIKVNLKYKYYLLWMIL